MCLGVFWVGWSWAAVVVATLLYLIRMFAITGFYHRYFSHKAYKTSRFWQFVFAVLGNMAVQRGAIWQPVRLPWKASMILMMKLKLIPNRPD